jgi:hypothetical protein|tara:strand:+ start:4018 stop:4254 length:237 start_codon:yes stop_codon:yes gene_type:complete
MQKSGGKRRMQWWMTLSLMLSLMLTSGCMTTKFENAHDLIKRHPKGFQDAVRASKDSEVFVRDCLQTINKLEEKLESK